MASRGFPGTWRCCTTATGVWALGQARCRLVTLRPSLVENRLARWLPKGLHRGYGVSACRSRRQVLPRCLYHRQEWVRSRTLGLNSKLASAISMHRHVVVSFKCCFVDHFGTRSVCRLMTVAHASQHGDCRAEIRRRKYPSWATAPASDLVAAVPICQRDKHRSDTRELIQHSKGFFSNSRRPNCSKLRVSCRPVFTGFVAVSSALDESSHSMRLPRVGYTQRRRLLHKA